MVFPKLLCQLVHLSIFVYTMRTTCLKSKLMFKRQKLQLQSEFCQTGIQILSLYCLLWQMCQTKTKTVNIFRLVMLMAYFQDLQLEYQDNTKVRESRIVKGLHIAQNKMEINVAFIYIKIYIYGVVSKQQSRLAYKYYRYPI